MEHQAKGRHLLVTYYEAEPFILKNEFYIEGVLRKLIKETPELTLLSISSYSFGEGQGCTSFGVLAESHVSVHTYPEHGVAFVDLFSCGDYDGHFDFARKLEKYLWGKIKTYRVLERM